MLLKFFSIFDLSSKFSSAPGLIFSRTKFSSPGLHLHCYLFFNIRSENTQSDVCASSKSLHCGYMNGSDEFLPFRKLKLHSLYNLKVFFKHVVSQLVYASLQIFKGILHFCCLIIVSYGQFTTPFHEQAEYLGERTASVILTHIYGAPIPQEI